MLAVVGVVVVVLVLVSLVAKRGLWPLPLAPAAVETLEAVVKEGVAAAAVAVAEV